jgi:hypothetical protein
MKFGSIIKNRRIWLILGVVVFAFLLVALLRMLNIYEGQTNIGVPVGQTPPGVLPTLPKVNISADSQKRIDVFHLFLNSACKQQLLDTKAGMTKYLMSLPSDTKNIKMIRPMTQYAIDCCDYELYNRVQYNKPDPTPCPKNPYVSNSPDGSGLVDKLFTDVDQVSNKERFKKSVDDLQNSFKCYFVDPYDKVCANKDLPNPDEAIYNYLKTFSEGAQRDDI